MRPAKPLTWRAATLAWFAILVLAVLNGGLREAVLIPAWGRTTGLMVSGVLLMAAVLAVTWALMRWRAPVNVAQCWRIGAAWLVATVEFEFALGLATGKRWEELLAAYRMAEGNLWPLVLAVVLVAPALVHRVGRAG